MHHNHSHHNRQHLIYTKPRYDNRNDRGERLLEFAKMNEMYIGLCNTREDGKPSRKWTWVSSCGRYRNMIDYVIIQRRWSSAVRECRTFPGADIDSDHNLVLCNILLKLKQQKRPQTKSTWNTANLQVPEVREEYSRLIEDRLKDHIHTDDPDEALENINLVIQQTAEMTLGIVRKTKKPWITEATLKLADKKRDAKGR